MNRSFLGASAAVAALLGLGLVPQISVAQSNSGPGHANLSQQDQTFLRKAAVADMFEVELGRIAQRNGLKPVVKEFGTWMECDHTLLQQMVRQVAGQVGVTVPRQLNATARQQLDELSRLSGATFDHAYTKDMVKDHEKDIQAFKEEARSGQNQKVKKLAARAARILEWHLHGAELAKQAVTRSGR
jgi:putative membrane protein